MIVGRVRATKGSLTMGGVGGGVGMCFACEVPDSTGWEAPPPRLHSFFLNSAIAATLAATLAGEKEGHSAAVWSDVKLPRAQLGHS